MAITDVNLPAFDMLLDQGLSVDSLDEGRHSRDVHYSLKESRKLYALVCCAFSNDLTMRFSSLYCCYDPS
jgi:hypothetical protein